MTTKNNLPIEMNIVNRDVISCKNQYKGYLEAYEETPNIPFVSFLFESLESKRIQLTQEIIDSIRYINAKSGL